MEAQNALGRGRVVGVADPLQQVRIALDELRRAPDLDAMTIRIVHEEHERLVFLAQVADGDVLGVSGEVRQAEGVVVQHLDESLGGP